MSSCRDRRELRNVRCETRALGSLHTVTYVFLFQGAVECGLEALEMAASPNASQARAAFCVLAVSWDGEPFSLGRCGQLEVSPAVPFVPWKPVNRALCSQPSASPILKGTPDKPQSPAARAAVRPLSDLPAEAACPPRLFGQPVSV